jgi:hypothetical protein
VIARPAACLAIATLAVTALAGGCSSPSSEPGGSAPPPVQQGPLPAGIVARAGNRAISAESVGRIAAAQKIDVAAARDRAVSDALLAGGAEARGLDRGVDVRLSIDGVLSRRLVRALRAEAERTPPTVAELTEAAEQLEQRAGIPSHLVADELLAEAVINERTRAAVEQVLAPGRASAERSRDADALLALVGAADRPSAGAADRPGPASAGAPP